MRWLVERPISETLSQFHRADSVAARVLILAMSPLLVIWNLLFDGADGPNPKELC